MLNLDVRTVRTSPDKVEISHERRYDLDLRRDQCTETWLRKTIKQQCSLP
jgi:hypothetical protein